MPFHPRPTLNHPILLQSFAVIDREIGEHGLAPHEYAILRRIIHSTADFEFKSLLRLSETAIEEGIAALQQRIPIVTDVTMVKQGIKNMVARTFQNPVVAAVEQAPTAAPGRTLTETGLIQCWQTYPDAIYVIGNAPTALRVLCEEIQEIQQQQTQVPSQKIQHPLQPPRLVIGVPVGFIGVLEAKQTLVETNIPKIWVEGRKGGSGVAAAILNALLVMAWERQEKGKGA